MTLTGPYSLRRLRSFRLAGVAALLVFCALRSASVVHPLVHDHCIAPGIHGEAEHAHSADHSHDHGHAHDHGQEPETEHRHTHPVSAEECLLDQCLSIPQLTPQIFTTDVGLAVVARFDLTPGLACSHGAPEAPASRGPPAGLPA